MNHDSIAYHFLGPKVWLRDHLIHPVPDEIQTAFPAVIETQYAALIFLGGQRAPRFFAVISLISILLVAASLALRMGLDRSGAWWTAALIVTMPAVYSGAYGGFVDVLFAAFVLAAARVAFDAETPGHYVLVGLMCGFATAAKYTGFIAWVLLVLSCFVSLVFLGRSKSSVALRHSARVPRRRQGRPPPRSRRPRRRSPVRPPPPSHSTCATGSCSEVPSFLHLRFCPSSSMCGICRRRLSGNFKPTFSSAAGALAAASELTCCFHGISHSTPRIFTERVGLVSLLFPWDQSGWPPRDGTGFATR